jgi:predicted ATPase/DNA-binding SARP family transcriptional activator
MADLALYLFGAPRIELNGVPVTVERRKALALFAYLAVTRQPHRRDALAALFWPDLDQARARAALSRSLYTLNQAMVTRPMPEDSTGAGEPTVEGWLTVEGDLVLLPARPNLAVDVERFRTRLAEVSAHRHSRGDLCPACLVALEEAAALYAGDFMAGFTLPDSADFDTWQTYEAENLRQALADALEALGRTYAARVDYAPALRHVRHWLALDPLCESAHRTLMELLAAAGDRPAALRQYDECARLLAGSLGIQPEPETKALRERIRRAQDGPARPAVPAEPSAPVDRARSVHPTEAAKQARSVGQPEGAVQAAGDPKAGHEEVEQRVPTTQPAGSVLPVDAALFVGRRQELAQIARLLSDPSCRLLTLVGPGGIGKTRLAVQAARELAARFTDGVRIVDLAPATSAELLAPTVALALGVSLERADPQQQLLGFLGDRHLLLLLDVPEQFPVGAGRAIAAMLRAAPGVTILAAARASLNLSEEWLLPIGGLDLPPGKWASAEEASEVAAPPDLAAYSALALFLHTVRRVKPDLQADRVTVAQAWHICSLLGGIPLAIQMAAAWVRALPLAEIAGELARGLDLLTTSLVDVPERQRSMRAAFEGSWQVLSPGEQEILRRLAPCVGGFTREAAAALASAGPRELLSLADASWLRLEETGRYRIHDLVRQYCLEKLAEAAPPDGDGPAYAQHAAYYAALLDQLAPEVNRQPGASGRLTAERSNLLAAWAWTIAYGEPVAVGRMAFSLRDAAEIGGWSAAAVEAYRGALPDLRARTQAAGCGQAGLRSLEAGADASLALVQSLECVCDLLLSSNAAVEQTQACLDEVLDLLAAGRVGREWVTARLIAEGERAELLLQRGEWEEAERILNGLIAAFRPEEASFWPDAGGAGADAWLLGIYASLEVCVCALGRGEELQANIMRQASLLADRSGLRRLRARVVDYRLAHLLGARGEYAQAEHVLGEDLEILEAFDDRQGIGHCLDRQALWANAQKQWAETRILAARCREMGREIGDGWLLFEGALYMGIAELHLGRPTEARRLLREALAAGERTGRPMVATPLALLGRVALAEGDAAGARASVVLALRIPGLAAWDACTALTVMGEVLVCEGQYEVAAELAAFLLTWPPTSADQRQDSEHSLRTAEERLPPDVFAAAVARGRARGSEDVLAEFSGKGA